MRFLLTRPVIYIDITPRPAVNIRPVFSTPSHRAKANARSKPHRPGRSLFPRCRSGRYRRVLAPAGMARSRPRPARPFPAPASAPLPRAAVLVARPAGPAARLGAGPRRVDPRCVRQRRSPGLPPPRHRPRASGLAGDISRHRGVRRQHKGVPPRLAAVRAAMVAEPRHHTRHDRPAGGDPGRHRNRLAAGERRCSGCSATSTARHARRTRACCLACAAAAGRCACREGSSDRSAGSLDHHSCCATTPGAGSRPAPLL